MKKRCSRKLLATLLSAVMMLNMVGTPTLAAVEGIKEHKHTEECYTQVKKCIHKHTAECYPDGDIATDSDATQQTQCSHICDEESGCVKKELDCMYEPVIDSYPDEEIATGSEAAKAPALLELPWSIGAKDGITVINVQKSQGYTLETEISGGVSEDELDYAWSYVSGKTKEGKVLKETTSSIQLENIQEACQVVCTATAKESAANVTKSSQVTFVITIGTTVELESAPYTIQQLKVDPSDPGLAGVTLTGANYAWFNSYGPIAEPTQDMESCLIYMEDKDQTIVCEITDESDNIISTICYNIKIKDSIPGGTVPDGITVPYGQAVTLQVNVQAENMEEITYTWSKQDGDSLLDKEKNTYTIDHVTSSETYSCNVGDKNSSRRIDFIVAVKNNFSAQAHQNRSKITVPYDGSAELIVDAFALNREGIGYKFLNAGTGETLAEGEENHITIENIVEFQSVKCEVTDAYGSTAAVYFEIFVDNQLKVTALNNKTNIVVPYGGDTTLEVECSANNMEGIRYEWFDGNYNPTSGETPTSLKIENITENTNYIFQATDAYGTRKAVYFQVMVQNKLRIKAKDDESNFFLVKGDSAVLSTVVSAEDMEGLTYTWLDVANERILPGENTPNLTLNEIQISNSYMCTVMDQYGNSQVTQFNIYIGNPLGVKGDQPIQTIYAEKGKPVTLETEVINTNNTELSYQWMSRDSSAPLYGETNPTLQLEEIHTYTTYRCLVTDAYRNCLDLEFNIELDNHFEVVPKDYRSDIRVPAGGDTTLEVVATADDSTGIAYRWIDENGELVSGESGNTLSLKNLTMSTRYSCIAFDQYNTEKQVAFNISIDNQFTVVSSTGATTVTVPKENQGAELSVLAAAFDTDGITYQWYDEQDFPIQGATAATYTTEPITQSGKTISCRAADRFGTKEEITFTVNIDTGFYASTKEGTHLSDIYVPYDEGITLEAFAIAEDMEAITYQWYETTALGIQIKLPGETTKTLAVSNVTQVVRYMCVVSDGYGAKEKIEYNVHIENHLSVYAKDNINTIVADEGASATLEVIAEADNTEGLTYIWRNSRDVIRGANTPTLTVSEITSARVYHCSVTDQYHKTIDIEFHVIVDNQFKLEAQNGETSIKVLPGDSATLSVSATGKDMSGITYRWKEENGLYLVDAEASVCNLKNIQKNTTISCIATDRYGTELSVTFEIKVDNELTIHAKDDKENIYVPYGTSAILEVVAHTTDMRELAYQWYKVVGSVDLPVRSVGKPTSTLETETITKRVLYLCKVQDQYGNIAVVDLDVGVDNGFYIEYRDDSKGKMKICMGEEAVLGVDASADTGELTYIWYEVLSDASGQEVKKQVAQADSNTLTLPDITKPARYICEVKDQYENILDLSFELTTTEHSYKWITDKKPTYQEEGHKNLQCTNCGRIIEGSAIKKLSHSDNKKDPAKPPFSDIVDHWFRNDIEFVASIGLFSGTAPNIFGPNLPVTREMLATALGRLAGADVSSYLTSSFTDVKGSAVSMPYIEWVNQKDIIKGTSAATFAPDAVVTREEMAVIMANYVKAMGYTLKTPLKEVTFTDHEQISTGARDAVKYMQMAGIIVGKDNNCFDPKGIATRAEISAVLHRFVELVLNNKSADGWIRNDSGHWLYYKAGEVLKGWQRIDGKWYYVMADGTLAVSTTIDGYEVDAEGARKEG